MLLMVLMVLPSELSAQKISAENFFATIKAEQNKIDRIRQGMTDAANDVFHLNHLESIAAQSPDPQAFIDFSLARFYRMRYEFGRAGAKLVDDVALYIRDNQYNVDLSSQVIKEGMAKYRDMRDFFFEEAYDCYEKYETLWNKHTNKYGDTGSEYFIYDNAFMKRYGVYVSDTY